jgi:16S rRNA (guanine966-N2)-methyltransferase
MRIIAGEWRGRTIRAPSGRDVRPTADRVREAWLGSLGGAVEEARVLDLFAGSGALGLEALSRGAREVVFVERARPALLALQANIDALGASDRSTVIRSDAFRYLDDLADSAFDLALADPPYGMGYAEEVLHRFGRGPFAREIWVEHGSREVLPEFPGLRQRRYGDTTLSIWEAPR